MRIAVAIPCFNETLAIGQVISGFKTALPETGLYVFDKHSTDCTGNIVMAHGATVIDVPLRGEGNVVSRMFADVEADVHGDGRR